MNEIFALQAISPIDGRYHSKTSDLIQYFSEFALMKYRVLVEVEYFLALSELDLPYFGTISDEMKLQLKNIYQNN